MNNIYFGESMYGGYYIEWANDDNTRGYKRFEKMAELKAFAKANNIDLAKANRLDN